MDTPEPSLRQVQVKTALLICGIFLAGAVAGIGLQRWVASPSSREGRLPLPLPVAELGLSAEQYGEAMKIPERHRAELEGIIRETFPRVRAIHEKMEAELRQLLRPEQAARLDAIQARRGGPKDAGPFGPAPGLGPGGPHPGGGGQTRGEPFRPSHRRPRGGGVWAFLDPWERPEPDAGLPAPDPAEVRAPGIEAGPIDGPARPGDFSPLRPGGTPR